MLEKFYQGWDVRPEFEKEFVCIFDGWLGKKNYHRLDEVTEAEWSKFNHLYRLLHQNYRLLIVVDLETSVLKEIDDVNSILESYEESQDKEHAEFTKIVIPELDAVYTEEWDYTSILWHKNNGAVEALSPLIKKAGLFHWFDPDAKDFWAS